MFLILGLNTKSQNIISFKEIIDTLPVLSWGKLPYFCEGFQNIYNIAPYTTPIDAIEFQKSYNDLLEKNPQECYTLNSKGKKFYCSKLENYKILENDIKRIYHKTTFNEDDSLGRNIKGDFYPCVFAVAKSYVGEYIVAYFRAWYIAGMCEYYALVFDGNYKLISAQSLDEHVIVGLHFPQFNSKNIKAQIEVAHAVTRFLPNGHLIIEYPFMLDGGGTYITLTLNEDGRFKNTHTWTEKGDAERIPNSLNYIRRDWSDDRNEWDTLPKMIPFKIVDKDGYTNIRETASTSSKILRKNYNNDLVWGMYENESWLKINFTINSKGTVEYGGFIHTSRLIQISDKNNGFIKQPSYEEWEKDKW